MARETATAVSQSGGRGFDPPAVHQLTDIHHKLRSHGGPTGRLLAVLFLGLLVQTRDAAAQELPGMVIATIRADVGRVTAKAFCEPIGRPAVPCPDPLPTPLWTLTYCTADQCVAEPFYPGRDPWLARVATPKWAGIYLLSVDVAGTRPATAYYRRRLR